MDYNKLYPVIGLIPRGRIGKWWIHKHYDGADFDTGMPGSSGHIVTKYYYPDNPRTPEQQGWRSVFYDAVKNWQGFDDSTKNSYNEMKRPIRMTGYNRYLRLYLNANYPMIIYWNTLEKSASDSSTIPDYIASDYFANGRYPPAASRLLSLGPSGDLPLPGKTAVDVITEKTAGSGVTVDGLLIKDGVADYGDSMPKTASWCSAGLVGDQENIEDQTWTLVELNAIHSDPGENFDTETNHCFTVKQAGTYLVIGTIRYKNIVSGKRYYAGIGEPSILDVGIVQSSSTEDVTAKTMRVLDLEKDDAITLRSWHNAGVDTVDIDGDSRYTRMDIHLLSTHDS